MNQGTEHGYLILADISGYTSYLAGVELTHAQDILAELLELIVQRFDPLLSIAKLEGDAVFAYAPLERVPRNETLLELMESTYLAFRDRIDTIRRRTTCDCNACRAIPNLDLKFILHYGEYLLQTVSGNTELVGSDVNLAHRLLKNQVGDLAGWKAYILFTEAGLMQLGIDLDNLHKGIEEYEHLGGIETFSLDLHTRYQQMIAARRVFISPEEADSVITRTVAAPPAILWDWLNDMGKRVQWETSYREILPILRPGGRMGAGATNHCAHGDDLILETILDWRPFEYYTAEYPLAIQSLHLEPTPDGTTLSVHFKLKQSLPRFLRRLIVGFMFRSVKADQQYDTLVQLIAEEAH